jgi:predicted CXXCH cytochrome family protein
VRHLPRSALREGKGASQCAVCHAPHASDADNALLRAPGAELCYSCHRAEETAWAAGTVHAPVRDGNCTTCHDGHAVRAADGKVALKVACTSCHDTAARELVKAHENFAVTPESCIGCHDPHQSAAEGLLRANRHEPFAPGSCETCHEPPAPGRGARLVAGQAELCTTCHGAVEKPSPPRGLHAPVEAGECTGCHGPHAASGEKLLRSETAEVCGSCHDDPGARIRSASAEQVHAPARDGNCRACHGGHEGVMPGLLNQAMPGLCADCHAGVAAQSALPAAHAPAKEGDCATCHDPHVGKGEHLLASGEGELCATCHDVTTPAFRTKHGGIGAGSTGCTSCHDPHGSQKRGLMLAHTHRPYEDKDCAACHDGTSVPAAGRTELCTRCHGEHAGDGSKPFAHAALSTEKGCLGCHSPHAGKTESLLIRDDVPKTCRSCHGRAMFERKFRHAEQDCQTCHEPHGGDNPGFLVEPEIALCQGCHEDVSKTHFHPIGEPAKDPRTGRAVTCSSCHDPHSSDQDALLTGSKDRELCVQCHLGPDLEVGGIGGR